MRFYVSSLMKNGRISYFWYSSSDLKDCMRVSTDLELIEGIPCYLSSNQDRSEVDSVLLK